MRKVSELILYRIFVSGCLGKLWMIEKEFMPILKTSLFTSSCAFLAGYEKARNELGDNFFVRYVVFVYCCLFCRSTGISLDRIFPSNVSLEVLKKYIKFDFWYSHMTQAWPFIRPCVYLKQWFHRLCKSISRIFYKRFYFRGITINIGFLK